MIKIKVLNGGNEKSCPPATQDVNLNLKNRQEAINDQDYGPANPDEPNEEFWNEKAKEWKTNIKQAKTMRCGNCNVFNMTKKMKDCIEKGMSDGQQSKADDYDAAVKDLGYCEMLKFKCAASRTCDAWVQGGPIKD